MFDRKATMRLFWPVFVEQTFAVTINFLATIMVRSVSEDAMAGVGLVGILNFLVMNAFSAVAAGVSVVVSQCVGRGDPSGAGRAGSQSVVLTLYLSAGIGGVMALLSRPMLGALFGGSEPAVLEAANIFFVWSCLSMPMLALFTTLSGIARSTGNVRLPMFCSVLSNVAYVLTAALCIQGLRIGVAGAGIAMAVSRLIPAMLMGLLARKGRGGIYLPRLSPCLNREVLRPVLKIAVPSGVDSLIFNGGKLLVNVFMSGMGTPVLAANSILNNLTSVLNLPGGAIQTIGVTITGQVYGKGDKREARRQMVRLTLYGMASVAALAAVMLAVLGPSIRVFGPSEETYSITRDVMYLIFAATPLFWPASFIVPQTLRACNDAMYTMWVSIVSMLLIRVFGSWLLGVYFGMGLLGIWLSMVLDWVLRGALFMPRMLRVGREQLTISSKV